MPFTFGIRREKGYGIVLYCIEKNLYGCVSKRCNGFKLDPTSNPTGVDRPEGCFFK